MRCHKVRPIQAAELLAHDYPLALARSPVPEDGEFDGFCPCATIRGEGFLVEMHCWRVRCEYGCPYSGIHISGTLDDSTLQRIAVHIRDRNVWSSSTDWRVVVNGHEVTC